jgi:protein tyrosine phosphatase (PTP) superfamily phosphohydrolase (DUF442 family)
MMKLRPGNNLVIFSLLLAQWWATPSRAQLNSIAPSVHALKADGITNFYQLSERIYSGSAPEGDAAFAELQARGIKTIITVDGAQPDADSARRFGIRYVHLPIGYDGVPADQELRLIKAAETLPGPIFVHCHHGQHRGPASAAVICMGTAGWTPEQGEAWLHLVGTATNYAGLYKSVETFRPPTPETLKHVSGNFSEKSDISPLAKVMVQVDGRFDNMKLIKKAGYRRLSDHPDLDPAPEALLLDELFKELLRSPITDKRTADFRLKLTEAEAASEAFYTDLNTPSPDVKKSEAAFQRLNDACAACHKAYRN